MRLDHLERGVGELKRDVGELKRDVAGMKVTLGRHDLLLMIILVAVAYPILKDIFGPLVGG